MGRYVDWQDIVNRYASVANNRGSEQTSIGVVIDDAEGEVDARLGARYAVPFVPGSSNAPQIVRTLSIDIAYYRINMQQKWAKDLKAYIDARFEALLDGSMAVVTSAGVVDPAFAGTAFVSTPHRSAFGTDAPEEWSVSEAELEDQAEARDGD